MLKYPQHESYQTSEPCFSIIATKADLILKLSTEVVVSSIPEVGVVIPLLKGKEPDEGAYNYDANGVNQKSVIGDDQAESDVVALDDSSNRNNECYN
jgi:hypothetical protein